MNTLKLKKKDELNYIGELYSNEELIISVEGCRLVCIQTAHEKVGCNNFVVEEEEDA